MMQALPVVVAMQHQFGAAGGDDILERAGVIQSAQRPRAAAMRRMMQQHDAREPLRLGALQQLREISALFRPRRPEATKGRSARPTTGQSARRPAPAQIGKADRAVVAAAPGAKVSFSSAMACGT